MEEKKEMKNLNIMKTKKRKRRQTKRQKRRLHYRGKCARIVVGNVGPEGADAKIMKLVNGRSM